VSGAFTQLSPIRLFGVFGSALDKSRQYHYILGMKKVVRATEARRTLLRLLEGGQKGWEITITY
jgi:hypothetical protein